MPHQLVAELAPIDRSDVMSFVTTAGLHGALARGGDALASRVLEPRIVRHTWTLAMGLALMTAARSAHADVDRARALYEQAGEQERQGQWAAAQESLRGALRLRETPHLHYALGWALENDDKLVDARAEYELAARLAREQGGADEAVRLATARLADLEKTIPVLKVRTARPGIRVLLDGREVRRDAEGATTPLNPGSHVLRIEREGEGPLEQIVYVSRGSVRAIQLDPVAPPRHEPAPVRPAPPLPPAAEKRDDTGGRRHAVQDRHARTTAPNPTPTNESHGIGPWVLLGAGVTSIAAGGVLLVAGSDSGRQQETTQEIAGFVVGGLGVVATTVATLLLVGTDDKPASPPAAGLTFAPGGPLLRF